MTLPNFLIFVTILILCLKLSSLTNSPRRTDGIYKYFDGRLDINIQDLDVNIGKVCDRIRKLDDLLTSMYKDPPDNGGEEMGILSRTYNQACLDLLYFCKLDKHKALKAAEDFVAHGNPKFMDVDFDEAKMGSRFKWNETELNGLHIIRSHTYDHWYDLWHLYKSLP